MPNQIKVQSYHILHLNCMPTEFLCTSGPTKAECTWTPSVHLAMRVAEHNVTGLMASVLRLYPTYVIYNRLVPTKVRNYRRKPATRTL